MTVVVVPAAVTVTVLVTLHMYCSISDKNVGALRKDAGHTLTGSGAMVYATGSSVE